MSLEAESPCGSSQVETRDGDMLPMDLLDEYWFFNNTLHARKAMRKPPLLPKPLPNKGKGLGIEIDKKELESENGISSTPKNQIEKLVISPLIRAPSLPSPSSSERVGNGERESVIDKSTDMRRSKLRYSCSSTTLGSRHSWHSAYESQDRNPSPPSLTRYRSLSDKSKYYINHHYNFNGSMNYKKTFQDKKWKSSNNLESIEVQGFKDLGFVFDKEELKESLANVIPGLREKTINDDNGNGDVTRPYLSEAWCVHTSAPPSFKWLEEKGSTADMKDQLRFWARAVACNVRQEG